MVINSKEEIMSVKIKCLTEDCPMVEMCYRIQAKDEENQSYNDFGYFCNKDSGFCDFIKITEGGNSIDKSN